MNAPTSVQTLGPFPGHSAFGLTADQSAPGSIPYNAGKTLEELLQEVAIDNYTNDFFLGLAHWGLRDRAIMTFFREMNGQSSAWQNKALADAFDGQEFYEARDERWDGDNRWYPLSSALDKDRRLDQMRAFQCAAALRGYANDPSIPEDQPPSYPNIKKRDTQGIQYLFLNWLCVESMAWNPALGDVVLHQKVSDRVRAALRSPQWIAAVANQVGHIEYHGLQGRASWAHHQVIGPELARNQGRKGQSSETSWKMCWKSTKLYTPTRLRVLLESYLMPSWVITGTKESKHLLNENGRKSRSLERNSSRNTRIKSIGINTTRSCGIIPALQQTCLIRLDSTRATSSRKIFKRANRFRIC
ncbi:hypothetical protein BS47DRAFT_1381980 [Hydnum rufescens UP504]|uniref:Uncharacterized protein n=1 Tax=Hydnum rufescens UP504 TaxID=1448309 RepID=A0A9P6B003_9AGAM|nr:hypothetical protein BS47DRAFT_1381980 [Hydnum rufescens UP504]